MYAIIMEKYVLSNELVLYNPIKIIEGELNNNKFIDVENNRYYESSSSFVINDGNIHFAYAYPISLEDLLARYFTRDLEKAVKSYYENVKNSFNFVFKNNNQYKMYQIYFNELGEFLTNPELLFDGIYEGFVKIPIKKLYMLTQLDSKGKLRKFIEEWIRKNEELEKLDNKKNLFKANEDIEEKDSSVQKTSEELEECYVNVQVKDKEEEKVNKNIRRDIDTEELEAYLKARIIGQDEQIERLVTVIADNYKTTNPYLIQRPLIIGPSGVGKTETLKLIAEYLKIPFTRYSTPTLSGTGYRGKDIESILRMVYQNAGKKIKACNETLIFLDEIDKIAKRGRDVSDEAVQNLLLNFLDGTVYDVEIDHGITVNIDTTLMNIVFGGAFEDMLNNKTKSFGFNSFNNSLDNMDVTTKDIKDFGFITEFIGRCSPKIIYNRLSREDLLNILVRGKLSPLLLKQQFYKEVYDVDLTYDESYINEVLNRVILDDTGARELKQIVFSSLEGVSHTLQGKSNRGKYSEVIVDKEILSDNKAYTLKKR